MFEGDMLVALVVVDVHISIKVQLNLEIFIETPVDVSHDGRILKAFPKAHLQQLGSHAIP